MFKNIGKFFEKKKVALNTNQNNKLKDCLSVFLKEKFGDTLNGVSLNLDYNKQENSLTIITDNQKLSQKLTLNLVELNEILKMNNIRLDKILIR